MSLQQIVTEHRASTHGTRILTLDIERLPGLARVWEPRTRYIPPRHFVEWPRMLCFAARWYDNPEPIFSAEWGKGGADAMIRKAWKLYDQADIVVTYNGVRFDDKHLRTEWLTVGLTPPRPWKSVDLYKQVGKFGFESKSLDTVTRRLGRPGKVTHYDMDAAHAAAEGDREAQARLRTYNLGDVELTEWLYDRLRGWMPNHPIMGAHGDEKVCNQCGSTDLRLLQSRYKAVVIEYALYRCRECGGHVRGGWHSRAASTRGVAS